MTSVRNLASASGVLLAGRVAGAACGFGFAVLLARALPQADVGVAFAAISSAFLASVLVTLNIESGSIRFLVTARENGRADEAGGFIRFSRLVFLCSTPIVVGGYATFFIVTTGFDALNIVIFAAASIPIIGWLRLSGAHATAMGRPAVGSLPRTALQPFLLLLFFPASLIAGAEATADLAMACFFASFAVTAVVQYAMLCNVVRTGSAGERNYSDWRNWLANGFFMSPIILLQEFLQHAVVMVAAITLQPSDVALLAISLRFVSLVRFGVLAINMASGPAISRAVARADHAERDRQLRTAALLKAPVAALACLGVVLCAKPLLALLGPDYVDGATALSWFTLIPLASALFGPNQMLLNISGARAWVFGVSFATINIGAIAIPAAGANYGVNGAAVAATAIFVGWEASLHLVTKARFGVDASIFAFAKRDIRR